MNYNVTQLTLPLMVVAVLGGIVWVSADDSNLPPGAVSPTMKTLTEVEPRTAINATKDLVPS